MCHKCMAHLLRTACYMKMHVAEQPYTKSFCIFAFKELLTLEGQEEYEQFPEDRATIIDMIYSKRKKDESIISSRIYKAFTSCKQPNGRIMASRDLPSINAFPSFDLKKESKMYLCDLDTPSHNQVTLMKNNLRTILSRYGPKVLPIPPIEAATTLGSSFYSDGHVTRRDYEKPTITWTSSWDYQKFKTDPRTEREVWLPPKGYKILSSWWHFFTEPLMRRIPYIMHPGTLEEVTKDVMKKFVPSTKLDLKGFGLQFPREYVIACMDVLLEFYPSPEIEDYRRSSIAVFEKLSIKMEDDTFITPKRGVGLGYFANLMTLCVAATLYDCNIVKMFSDDILCPIPFYEKARGKLIDAGFIINEKKSGKEWYSAPFFGGVTMTKAGYALYYTAQGVKAAIFTKRWHYQRKAIMLASSFKYRWKANYHYERIFGYEVSKCEAFKHTDMLGLDPTAPRPCGWVKGGLLRKYKSPRIDDENMRRFMSISFPWKSEGKDTDFLIKRRSAKKVRNIVHYVDFEDYMNPPIRELPFKRSGFNLNRYTLPAWADLQTLVNQGYTCGRTTFGRNPNRVASRMLDYLLADNPIFSATHGGYEIDSPFYRVPGVDAFTQTLYDSLRTAVTHSQPLVLKRKGDSRVEPLESGLDFMRKFAKESGVVLESRTITFHNEIVEEDYLSEDDEPSFDAPDDEFPNWETNDEVFSFEDFNEDDLPDFQEEDQSSDIEDEDNDLGW